ncbi:metallophosphoesterase [Saccharopolyspora taberi]|uniref:Metallophosphoesterase n=1 Tax=Saccharopolyspora taberi TaxID=60895 RepID=A0ABN3VLX0_9PSEU
MNKLGRILLTGGALGAATFGYAAGIERRHWTLRHATLPVLAEGSPRLRVLHVSDLHMMPTQHSKQRWVSALDELEPDLVVNTGDNLAHPQAVPTALRALGPLLDRPGIFVFGSNDYYGPKPKNWARYLVPSAKQKRIHGTPLPWRDLRAAMTERGWIDATHRRHALDVGGVRLHVAGLDDPHLHRDKYSKIAGPVPADAQLNLGVTHSPEPRVLDAFADDGYDLVLAGHTHGGQLRLPGYGALVTNCELDRSRARGASTWGEHMRLHVSAGLGTSPYAPVRFACPPEATLLTLVPRSQEVREGGRDRVGGAPFGAGANVR